MKSRNAINQGGSPVFLTALATISLLAPQARGDDFESGPTQWQATGNWGLTTSRHASPTHAATDTPGAFYTNNSDTALTLASSVDLSAMDRPALAFHHSHELESGYDSGRVEVSTNNGATWQTTPLASYSGSRAAMAREQLDLAAFDEVSNFKIRFRLVTDSSVVMDGWYLDDVVIGSAPLAVTLQTPGGGALGQTSVALTWTASGDPSFTSYVVLRGTTAGFDWRTAKTVAVITDANTTGCVDIAVAPKSAYRYKVMTLNSAGLHSPSNEVSAITPAGMDYPFLDDGEGGPNLWVATAPWALSEEDYQSPGHAWSDSPGGNYEPSTPSQALTLAAPVNLTSTTDPILCFNHRYVLAGGDYGYVEISSNNGTDWTTLATFSGSSPGLLWERVRLSLAAYRQPAILVRFRLTSDPGSVADGWHLDDISLSESPPVVPAPAVDQVSSNSARLSWQQSPDGQVNQYAVFRSTVTGVGRNSTLLAVVNGAANTTFTDTGLLLDTNYYYRVFAVNNYGGYSADSPSEALVHTLNNPPPFADGFEGGTQGWIFNGAWGVTSELAATGTKSLTDSPGSSYGNSQDTWAETSVDLRGTTWPVLKFKDRYSLGGGDWLRVEVYDVNQPWYQTIPYGVHESSPRTEWREQQIDLSEFKGRANVRIRFRVATDGATPGDGWFIDDLSVTENVLAATPQTLPMQEGFESGLANWISAGWITSDAVSAKEGPSYAWDSDQERHAPSVGQSLTLARTVSLPADSNVQVTFWANGVVGPGSWFRLQYSQDDGVTWPELATANLDNPFNPGTEWRRLQASLQTLAGKTVRLRFTSYSDGYARAQDVRIDKLTIAEMPAAVTLTSALPTLRSVALTWTPGTLGADFQRYEVWRSTTANVTVFNGSKIFESASAATTTFNDTGLAIGTTYYYRIFSVDLRDAFIPSNESAATTVPSGIPLTDPMDTLGNWVPGTTGAANTWGISTFDVHEGSGCLALSPAGQYANSSDTWMETAVDLSGTVWPVLKFWDRYALGENDWLRVEIYDGIQTWYQTFPYGLHGPDSRTGWREQQIDLSELKGRANVRIRFRVATDGATPGDGWFIDDLSVTENALAATPQTLPMQEGFESGLANWISAGWITSDALSAKEGPSYAWDSDQERHAPSVGQSLTLARPVVLPPGSNVQVTFWANGVVGPGSWFRLQYSQDDGVTWPELATANLDNGFNPGTEWRRLQASLQTLAGKTVRLRFTSYSDGYARAQDVRIDKLTIAEMPDAVTLTSALPTLRSVALTWTPGTLGADFQRYEVWRSTTANVTVFNGSKIFESASAATTTFNDTGLAIGTTYYYRIFSVDLRDAFIPSNESAATTVPSGIPLTDPMDTLGNWVPGTTGAANTWGISTFDVHEGSGCLALSPAGQYANSSDTWMETAVDLSGTVWPVLKFWDRYALGEGDWLRVEIYDGIQTWYQTVPYGVHGPDSRTGWREQQIDLSEFKGRANVRIRFRVATDGATPGDGWFIDDLSVTENVLAATPQTLPMQEGFESGLANWISAGWITSDAVSAKEGPSYAWDSDQERHGPSVGQSLTLARTVSLPADSNVQVTFWANGVVGPGSWFRLQYSQDDGVTWPELATANLDNPFNPGTEWRRLQASLQTLAGKTVRLRFTSYSDGYARAQDVRIDKLTIAEMPAAVTLTSALPTLRSVALTWTPGPLGADFQRYEVWRSTTANVTVFNGSKIFESASAATTTFNDTGLLIGQSYFYRVFCVDGRDTFIPSNELTAVTLPAILPLVDPLEDLGNWMPGTTGAPNTWGITATGVHGGSGCLALTTSGQYANSSDTWMETAVNLNGTVWPVLKFWDRYALGEGDWLRVEVYDGIQTWYQTVPYGVHGPVSRTGWREQQIDLSEFKGRGNVRIRFRAATDGGTPSDGWFIDDMIVAENPHAASPLAMPFFETAEAGPAASWQASGWGRVPDSTAPGGSYVFQDTENARCGPGVGHTLTLSRPVVLPQGTSAAVTYWVRGVLPPGSWCRLQYSQNDGVTWTELPAANLDAGFDTSVWQRKQVPLASLGGLTVRLRFISYSDAYARASDIFLDNIGIGEPAPAAPVLVSPAVGALVPDVRPLLTLQNAIDVQSDPLTYRFEVYADAALTTLVAQVPAVSGGTTTTSWQVDVNLTDHAPYWWRARATDGTNTGPWSEAVVFNINEFNNPPLPVTIAGPANDSLLIDGNGLLVWFQTFDPDLGDEIRDYQIQIDNDYQFGSPEVDFSGITVPPATYGPGFLAAVALDDLPGTASLPSGRWFWRIRARDTRFASGAWAGGYAYFRLPTFYLRYLRSLYPDPEWFLENVTNPGADPDGNGVGVLMEFACAITPGANPGNRLPRPIELQIEGATHQGFEWTRRKVSELGFVLETSTNLTNWYYDSRAGVEILYPVDDLSERVRIIDPDPVGSHFTRFIRMHVKE